MSKKFRMSSPQQRVTGSQTINRTGIPGLTPPPKPSISAIGVIGWMAAVAGVFAVVTVLVMGQTKHKEYERLCQEQLHGVRLAVNNATNNPSVDLDAFRAEATELRKQARALADDVRRLEDQERRQRHHWEGLSQSITQDDQQVTDLFARLGIKQKSFAEFQAHYTSTMKARAAAAATPTKPAEPVALPTPERIVPPIIAAAEPPRRTEPAAPPQDEEPAPNYIAPDTRFISLDVTSRRKTRDSGNYYWDNTRQTISVKVNIKNGHFTDEYADCTLHVLIIGVNAADNKVFATLDKSEVKVTLASRSNEVVFDRDITVLFADKGYSYGYKYDSYLVVLCDQQGNAIVSKSPRNNFVNNMDKIVKVDKYGAFDRNGDKVARSGYIIQPR